MAWITESPLPLFFLALIAQVILGLVLWQSGQGWILFAMLGLAGVSLSLLILEWLWVTPREEIAYTLDAICVKLQANQPEEAVEYISPKVPDLRSRALKQLKRTEVSEARVTSEVQVTFDPPSETPTATATFFARMRAKDKKDASPYEQLAQRFKVFFRKEDGRWKVSGVETLGFR